MKKDVLIIGAGPAGLTAGLYAARAKMDTVIFESFIPGGQIATTMTLENYPGAMEGVSGPEFGMRMQEQAESFGAEVITEEVLSVELKGKTKRVITENGEYEAPAIIIATGAKSRPLGVPGEEKLKGKGISYCATCDAALFNHVHVYVVGGGDTAVEEALFISKFARKVTIIHRRDELRAAKSLQEKAFQNPIIDFMWNTVVEEIKGENKAESFLVRNVKTGEVQEIKADEEDNNLFGLFILVGFRPETNLFEGQIDMEKGYILTDEKMKTNIPGVFAAGDVRVKNTRQVVTATSDGAIAGIEAEHYISDLEES